jgi:hypothetical protein
MANSPPVESGIDGLHVPYLQGVKPEQKAH